MSYLTLDASVVSVAVDTGEETPRLIGERARAIDDTLNDDTRIKREWTFRTTPLGTSAASTLKALLQGATPSDPIVAAGDIIGGSVDVVAEVTGVRVLTTGPNTRKWEISFTLIEI